MRVQQRLAWGLALGLTLPPLAAQLAGCGQSGPERKVNDSSAGKPGLSACETCAGGAANAGASAGSGGAQSDASAGTTSSAGSDGGSASAGTNSGGGTASSVGSGGAASGAANGGSSGRACPIVSDFASWPSGKGPVEVGKLAVTDFKSHTSDAYDYPVALAWAGALSFTSLTADASNNAALIAAWGSSKLKSNPPPNPMGMGSVDHRVFGVLPLQLYLLNHDESLKELGLSRANNQWLPPLNPDGITTDARFWSDDMFMISELLVMAYRASKDQTYLDHGSKALLLYVQKLLENSLFWHTLESFPAWGRANGWFSTGMAELLLELPASKARDGVLTAYQTHMQGLVPLQVSGGDGDGCWRQVLNLASSPIETSCTAMFTNALATGVKNGWLTDAKYAAAARKGWLCVANNTNAAGKLDRVCPGTGAAAKGDPLAKQQQFYVERMSQVQLGDLHGQLALFGAANALVRTDCPGVR